MSDEQYGISESPAFDMGFSTLARINYALWNANIAQTKNDIDSWVQWLKIIYKELYPFLNEKTRENQITKQNEVIKFHKQYLDYNNNFYHASKSRMGLEFAPPKQIFDSVLNWEFELRALMDKTGLLMKKGEDASQAMT